MASLSFSITGLDQINRLAAAFSPKTIARAQRAGITAASRAVHSAAAQGIASRYGLSSRRARFDIRRPSFSDAGQAVTVPFSRRPPTLTQYGARPGTRATGQRGLGRGLGWSRPAKPGKPVTALVMRSRGRQPVANAFLATGRAGNQLVLRRSTARPGKLNAIYGPSIGSIFLGKSAIATELQADVQTRINEQFIKGFERVLSSAARGYGGRR